MQIFTPPFLPTLVFLARISQGVTEKIIMKKYALKEQAQEYPLPSPTYIFSPKNCRRDIYMKWHRQRAKLNALMTQKRFQMHKQREQVCECIQYANKIHRCNKDAQIFAKGTALRKNS